MNRFLLLFPNDALFVVLEGFHFRVFLVLNEAKFIEMGIKVREARKLTFRPVAATFHDLQHPFLVGQWCALEQHSMELGGSNVLRNQDVARRCFHGPWL